MPPNQIASAETYYLPAPPRPRQPAEDWSDVPGAERLYRWAAWRLSRRVPIPEEMVPDAVPVYARIDDGRWIGQCTECRSAWFVSTVDPRFGCIECRLGWVPMILPDDVAAAEAVTLPLLHRFWWHPDDPENPVQPMPEPEPPVIEEPQP